MPEARVLLPCLNSGAKKFEVCIFLAALEPFWESESHVVLDFTNCSFLSAEGAAIVSIFKLSRNSARRTTAVDWGTVYPSVAKQLGRWKLASLFGKDDHPWTDNAIPLFHQPCLDSKALLGYICSHITPSTKMPAMTPNLLKEVQKSLCELFQNVFAHSCSSCGGIAIGQFYPRLKQVQICISDGGLGIARKVLDAGVALPSAGHALSWALEEGNTTRKKVLRPGGPHVPGGLGLFFLRKFVKTNQGNLRVVANKGFLFQAAEKFSIADMPVEFPGTLVQLNFNVRSDVTYKLVSDQ
jgi:hypothetical protein